MKKKLSILHIVHAFPPMIGGTATRQKNMVKDGNRHVVYTRSIAGLAKSDFDSETCEVHYSKWIARLHAETDLKVWPLHLIAAFTFVMYSIISQRKSIDVIHAHNPLRLSLLAYIISLFIRKPFIYELHTLAPYFSIEDHQLPLSYKLVKKIDMFLLNRCSGIIVQFPAQAKIIKNQIKNKEKPIIELPVAIDTDLLEDAVVRNIDEISASLKLKILFVGLLEEINGIEFLIDLIIKNVSQSKYQFVIAGTGSYEKSILDLQKLYPDRVCYLGSVNYDAMAKLYSQTHIAIIPAPRKQRWEENIPTKLIEAIAFGNIVVASDIDNFKNWAGSRITYFEAENVNSAIDTLEDVARQYCKFLHIAQLHAVEIKKELAYSKVWRKVNDFYRQIS